ncbi:hypothetical protein [Spongiivirga citrea]|uniref:Uncharacterized protein n=1 Tax=Spongiivirga citrea TaxID=1481457 RepID=A0A6M0CLA6_9FLAO|nr:hypothetical protein [Spongiivirga citrea]NER18716.1 hypothetical protein [Spongiivirga citrea]
MKTSKQATLLLIVITMICSCNKIDELTEFDVTDGFSTTMNISVTGESSEPQIFSEAVTVDISTNQDIQDNLDLIQDININSLTYEVSNFAGTENTTVTNASLSFDTIRIDIENINLQQADTANTIYTITDSTKLRDIAAILKSSASVTATLEGTVSDTPVIFDVIINLNLTATVDVL